MKSWKFVANAVVALAVLWLLYESLVTVVPPRAMTVTAIGESFARIHLYAKEHQRLPSTIAEFPRRDGYSNNTDNGWGNPLRYTVAENGTVTLKSLGADNKLGGLGDNADVSRSYASTDHAGRFIADDDSWLTDSKTLAQ